MTHVTNTNEVSPSDARGDDPDEKFKLICPKCGDWGYFTADDLQEGGGWIACDACGEKMIPLD